MHDNLIVAYYILQSHPGGLLFTKFGCNQTALLDIAFSVCFTKIWHVFWVGILNFIVNSLILSGFSVNHTMIDMWSYDCDCLWYAMIFNCTYKNYSIRSFWFGKHNLNVAWWNGLGWAIIQVSSFINVKTSLFMRSKNCIADKLGVET